VLSNRFVAVHKNDRPQARSNGRSIESVPWQRADLSPANSPEHCSSSLSPVLVDLVYLRVSQINNCAYCLNMHTRDLLKKGVKVEKLALLQAWQEAGSLFDEPERAALA